MSRTARRTLALWLAAVASAACASSAPPVPAPPDPAPVEARPVPPETPPIPPEVPVPIAPGPWFLLDRRHVVLADGVQDTWFDNADFGRTDIRERGPGIWLPAKIRALPEAARHLIDTPLVLLTEHTEARCSATVQTLWVASVPVFDPRERSPFHEALHKTPADGHEPTPAERAAAAWGLGHRLLVAELGETDHDACRGPFIAAKPDRVPLQLRSARAAPAIAKRAFRALRATSFWEVQQEAYLKSLVVARVRYHGHREEERQRQIADGTRPSAVDLRWITDPSRGAPRTWDTPTKGGDRPEVQTLSDPDGTLRYVFVRTGNGLSCAAPAAWALFDPDYALVDFGLTPRSFLFLDWDGDGQIDLLEGGHQWRRVHALALPGHPILAALEVQPHGLACSMEQIGPLPAETPTPP